MTNQTQKPVVIITGAAGGMGSALAIRLAVAGNDLILCDIDPGGVIAMTPKAR